MIEAMNQRRRPTALLLLIGLAAVALAACADEPEEPQRTLERGTMTIVTEEGPVRLDVEIAETDREKQTGLMHRESLGERSGMVFLEEQPVRIAFTMRNTRIPLSLAVWGPDGRIRSIIDMDPCRSEPCPSYDPGVAWVGALEVNQGFFEEHGVEVGDVVRLEH
ncbi:MAG TPA: DUF192 domain-containing protein [Actinomycetota bacterium]|nr:DUF192 domain-containing protein [Actinomycetota bacterium]